MRRLIMLGIVVAAMAMMGCAQNTETPIGQYADQVTQTPTTTAQEAATQGSSVNVWIINAPGAKTLPSKPDGDGVDGLAAILDSATNEDLAAASTARYAQAGFSINITTGGTTPSVTGTTTGQASATQTPSATTSSNPVQDVKPDVSASVPVSIAPGGISDISSTSGLAGADGTVASDKTSTNDLISTRIKALESQMASVADLLSKLFASIGATETPATQPSE